MVLDKYFTKLCWAFNENTNTFSYFKHLLMIDREFTLKT